MGADGLEERPRSRDHFRIAILCDIPITADAVMALFDEAWEKDPFYGKAFGDSNSYSFGRIGGHSVVLVHAPPFGGSASAAVAAGLRVSFNNIRLALLVGLCGAVPRDPKTQKEIFLGDVIISTGIVQIDSEHRFPDAEKIRSEHKLLRPNTEIRNFLSKLSGSFVCNRLAQRTNQVTRSLLSREKYQNVFRPSSEEEEDTLYPSDYRHKHRSLFPCELCDACDSPSDPVCALSLVAPCSLLGCNKDVSIKRYRLKDGEQESLTSFSMRSPEPHVHFGMFATGDLFLRSARQRDELSQKDAVIAFQMEDAAIWYNLPTIMIKGVCDYADGHRNETWQQYATVAAAACLKAVLSEWRVSAADDDDDDDDEARLHNRRDIDEDQGIRDNSPTRSEATIAFSNASTAIEEVRTAAYELYLLLRNHDDLQDVYKVAPGAQSYSADDFEKKLRSSLKQLALDLKSEARTNIERSTVPLISSQARILARELRGECFPSEERRGLSLMSEIEDENAAPGRRTHLEKWLKGRFALKTTSPKPSTKLRVERQEYVEPTRRIIWRDDEAVFNFGQYKGWTLRQVTQMDPVYLNWIVDTFSQKQKEVVNIVKNALNGKFPSRADERVITHIEIERVRTASDEEDEGPIEDGEKSDGDDDDEEPTLDQSLSSLAAVKDFIIKSSAFNDFVQSLQAWTGVSNPVEMDKSVSEPISMASDLPEDLSDLRLAWHQITVQWEQEVGWDIPWDPTTFTSSYLRRLEPQAPTVLDVMKMGLESYTGGKWDWWPLSPPKRPLQNCLERIEWNTPQWRSRWVDVSVCLAMRLLRLYSDTLDSSRWGENVTGKQDSAFGNISSNTQQSSVVHPTNSLGSSSHRTTEMQQTYNTPPTNNPATTQQGSGIINHPPSGQGQRKPSVSSAQPQSSPQEGNFANSPIPSTGTALQNFHILFCVPRGRGDLREAIISSPRCNDCKVICDFAFFENLRQKYYELRGFWRYWLLPWQFDHCHGYKFQKYHLKLFPHCQEFPLLYPYEIEPPAQSPYRSTVAEELWYDRFYENGGWHRRFSKRFYHAFGSAEHFLHPHSTKLLKKMPRRVTAFDLDDDLAEEYVWGLRAELRISFAYIFVWQVVLMAAGLGFYFWWLTRYPNDLQNAIVPWTIIIGAFLFFWTPLSAQFHAVSP